MVVSDLLTELILGVQLAVVEAGNINVSVSISITIYCTQHTIPHIVLRTLVDNGGKLPYKRAPPMHP